jgi:hypothetical protein
MLRQANDVGLGYFSVCATNTVDNYKRHGMAKGQGHFVRLDLEFRHWIPCRRAGQADAQTEMVRWE